MGYEHQICIGVVGLEASITLGRGRVGVVGLETSVTLGRGEVLG